jgi:hypothetical protein
MPGQTSGAPAGRCSDGKTNVGTCLHLPRLLELAGSGDSPQKKPEKSRCAGSGLCYVYRVASRQLTLITITSCNTSSCPAPHPPLLEIRSAQ